jgi:hypothetical protein
MKRRSLTHLREEMRAVARGERKAPRRPATIDSGPKIDAENPEWTEADFSAAQGPEALPPALLAAFPRAKAGAPAGRRGSTRR